MIAKFTAGFGLAVVLAPSGLGASELGQSATFSIGTVVVDMCQVPDVYRAVLRTSSRRVSRACTVLLLANYAAPEPVTTVSRAEDGTITALKIEF